MDDTTTHTDPLSPTMAHAARNSCTSHALLEKRSVGTYALRGGAGPGVGRAQLDLVVFGQERAFAAEKTAHVTRQARDRLGCSSRDSTSTRASRKATRRPGAAPLARRRA